ncbi:hypothetical protein EX30DRAFT_115077 [Ascodesmis nigricans]|uniref:Uncharacterized protein n=1 Tax=Ascodesmis nigricans TaxID=341454 RepID=A0A4S2MSS0_9PEZI|nr:hypothetical protein EX30DRAFT_115077 [Ascodesmis nigricans]
MRGLRMRGDSSDDSLPTGPKTSASSLPNLPSGKERRTTPRGSNATLPQLSTESLPQNQSSVPDSRSAFSPLSPIDTTAIFRKLSRHRRKVNGLRINTSTGPVNMPPVRVNSGRRNRNVRNRTLSMASHVIYETSSTINTQSDIQDANKFNGLVASPLTMTTDCSMGGLTVPSIGASSPSNPGSPHRIPSQLRQFGRMRKIMITQPYQPQQPPRRAASQSTPPSTHTTPNYSTPREEDNELFILATPMHSSARTPSIKSRPSIASMRNRSLPRKLSIPQSIQTGPIEDTSNHLFILASPIKPAPPSGPSIYSKASRTSKTSISLSAFTSSASQVPNKVIGKGRIKEMGPRMRARLISIRRPVCKDKQVPVAPEVRIGRVEVLRDNGGRKASVAESAISGCPAPPEIQRGQSDMGRHSSLGTREEKKKKRQSIICGITWGASEDLSDLPEKMLDPATTDTLNRPPESQQARKRLSMLFCFKSKPKPGSPTPHQALNHQNPYPLQDPTTLPHGPSNSYSPYNTYTPTTVTSSMTPFSPTLTTDMITPFSPALPEIPLTLDASKPRINLLGGPVAGSFGNSGILQEWDEEVRKMGREPGEIWEMPVPAGYRLSAMSVIDDFASASLEQGD